MCPHISNRWRNVGPTATCVNSPTIVLILPTTETFRSHQQLSKLRQVGSTRHVGGFCWKKTQRWLFHPAEVKMVERSLKVPRQFPNLRQLHRRTVLNHGKKRRRRCRKSSWQSNITTAWRA